MPSTAAGIALGVLYFVTAQLGFQVAFVAEQVTTVWAPTGLAQAALLLWGRRLWPAIWLGAFVANAGTQAPLWTAAAIATGNTFEAVAAVTILSRFRGFDPALRHTRDALAFIIFAAFLAPVISASIGVVALCAAAVQPWSRFAELWRAWWLGDALGALVVAPVLLTILRKTRTPTTREWIESAAIIASTVLVTAVVFGESFGLARGVHPLEYAIFPFLIAACVRLGQPATSLVVLSASSVAIWFTVRGVGPFASTDVHESLKLLQAFTATLATTAVLLAAAIEERRTGEKRRAAAFDVGQVLADGESLPAVAPDVLRAIGEQLNWAFGALWVVETDAELMRCVSVWKDSRAQVGRFEEATRAMSFPRGVGLPGRVWASGHPAWIENIENDANFPRAGTARPAHLHGAFAFPICVGQEVVGVVEFFHHSALTPDHDLLTTMSTVGNQVGAFIARKRTEKANAELLQRELSARLEAEAADRAKDEFLATLSHELRTPLNAVLGYIQMLRGGVIGPDRRDAVLATIERNALLQKQLIEDVLDVSRIITGKLRIDLQPVDLTRVVEEAVTTVAPGANAKGVSLLTRHEPAAAWVAGDAQRLQQVVWNLLSNAVKFTPRGGQIEIELRCGSSQVELDVRDTGEGVPPQLLPRLFDRFWQADSAITRSHGGLGLGLAICRHLVEAHGGRIHATSAGKGQGTTVGIELPRLFPKEAGLYPAAAIRS